MGEQGYKSVDASCLMEGNKGRLRKMHGLVKSQFNMSCVILQPLIIMFQANEIAKRKSVMWGERLHDGALN